MKIRPTIAEEAKEDIYFATVEFLCLSRFAIKSRIRHINAEDNVYFKANEGDVVEEVIGEDKIKEMNEVVTYQPFLYKGYSVKNDKPAKITMLTLYAKDLDVILSRIETINSILSVKSER